MYVVAYLEQCSLKPLLEVDVVMQVIRPHASSIIDSLLGQDSGWDACYSGLLLGCSSAWRAGF
jgi:hypothetical protein